MAFAAQKSTSSPENSVTVTDGHSTQDSSQHRHPLVGGEQRVLADVRADGDHHAVVQLGGPSDHVEMTDGDGVEGSGADGSAHGRRTYPAAK